MPETLAIHEEALLAAIQEMRDRLEGMDLDSDTYALHAGFYAGLVWVHKGGGKIPAVQELENAWMLDEQ